MPGDADQARSDRRYMRMALRMARRGLGHTRPNPPVGAVIVQDGEVVGCGYHHGAGQAHAEVAAVAAASAPLRGATIYVTLEPCSTFGRTPPCTELLIAEGFQRVVVGALDTNPRHSGRGLEQLRQAGMRVDVGVCRREAEELIAPFSKHLATGMPLVTVKLALTLDGRLADRDGRSQWITGPEARRWVQRLRRGADAVMVGAGTAVADDPELRCRLPGAGANWRVVVSASGCLPSRLRLFTDAYAHRTLVATTKSGAETLRARLAADSPVLVWAFDGDSVPLEALLGRLGGELDIMHLVCEGGGQLAGGLLRAGLIDSLACIYAPAILADTKATCAFAGANYLLDRAPRGAITRTQRLGGDFLLKIDGLASATE